MSTHAFMDSSSVGTHSHGHTTCFCEQTFIETHPHPFIYVLSVAAFVS